MSQNPTLVDTITGGGDTTALTRLQTQLQELQEQLTFHLGTAPGAMQGNTPHTNMLFPYREIHGPSRQSIDSTHNVTFIVDFDETVAWLHQSKLTVRMSAVRSNVSASSGAAGGGTTATSTGGGTHRHEMWGGTAFNATPLGNVKVTGTTVADHKHTLDATTFYCMDSANKMIVVGWPYIANNEVGSDYTTGLYTFVAASDHTHDTTLANHSHTITMTYGIYVGSSPATPAVTVTINGTDRTTALGGPWDTDFTVDVTQYLREASGDPLRQANSIVFTSAELIDLDVVCKSFVSAASPFAAGVPGL